MTIRRAAAMLLATSILVACSKAPETDEAMMKSGLELLYAKRDPNAAAAQFRKMLERNPRHYGATFQLAMALDRAGKPSEARPIWEKMLAMAEAARDSQTTATARARLGQAQVASKAAVQEDLMKAGLDALYTRGDAAAAAALFSKVLEQNPDHYGATFQLAMALDRAGKPAAARLRWEQALKMAERYKDKATADTARARLLRRP